MARNGYSVTEEYVKTVAKNVAMSGQKPEGDFITGMARLVKAEIVKTVPANYRLAVRMAIQRKANAALAALKGI